MFHDRRFSPQPGVVVACIPVAAGGDKSGDEPSHRSGSGDDTGIVEHVAQKGFDFSQIVGTPHIEQQYRIFSIHPNPLSLDFMHQMIRKSRIGS
jgi:hypothetical protein